DVSASKGLFNRKGPSWSLFPKVTDVIHESMDAAPVTIIAHQRLYRFNLGDAAAKMHLTVVMGDVEQDSWILLRHRALESSHRNRHVLFPATMSLELSGRSDDFGQRDS